MRRAIGHQPSEALQAADRNTSTLVGSGQLAAEVLEHAREDRHDEEEHADDGDDGDDEDDDRVGHRRLHLAAELDLGLVVLRQLQQHTVQEATDLARTDHIYHERREGVRVLCHADRQRAAGLDLVADLSQDPAQLLVLSLVGQDAQ
jgi:hypothetical protein